MGWAGQTWMRIIQEGTGGANYGTYESGGSKLWPVLYGGDAFTARVVPARQVIRTADAGNRRKQVVANKLVCVGRLNTLIYPSQAPYWVAAIASLSSNYLPSYSVEWDSVRAWRFLGGMIRTATVATSADQDYGTLSMEWIFQQRDATFTTFTQPAESNYPTEVPYCHVESAGNVLLGGSAISKYKNMSVTINNTLVGTWDELGYITALYYCGRDLDFQLGPQYLATTYRGDYEAQTALTWVLEWVRAGSPGNTLTFTCETNSYISNIDDQLPLDGPGYNTLGVQCFYDAANTADFVAAAT